jgi:hypothetical protein
MTAPVVEGSQDHYLQLADAVLKRVTFDVPTRSYQRMPDPVSKAG